MANIDENLIRTVVAEVLKGLQNNTPTIASNSVRDGVFDDMDEACRAAQTAFEQLRCKGVAARRKVVEIVKSLCERHADDWGRIEFEETKIGRLDHKIAKLHGIRDVLGTEYLLPHGMSGDMGITLDACAPFGVIGAITPVTHSIPTIAGNIVNMVAAGNAVVFNPHPGGAKCAALAIREFNRAIESETGITNLVCTIAEPSLDSFNQLCAAPEISLLCITGGPAVVEAAMKTGKRAICAGPGNPPVVVDDCSALDFDKVARDIILGAGFDNNLLCIGEKQVFAVGPAYDALITAMRRNGAVLLTASQLEKIKSEVFTFRPGDGGCSHPVLNRAFVGASPRKLASVAGIDVPDNTELLIAETAADDLFVVEEQMMPVLPIIRSTSIEAAIRSAKISEHNYKHSAMIHTMNVANMTIMAQEMDTTLFVKNGPCVAGLGMGGEGYISFSIATTTGEGITTPRTFTRFRRCALVEQLNML